MTDTGSLLVVDDDRFNRILLATMVREEGHHSDLAESGAQALEMVCYQDYDVILLDLLMPGMDGFEVLREIRNHEQERIRSIPVIIISGEDDREIIVKCLQNGADDYLFKPINDRVLLSTRVRTGLLKNKAREQEILNRELIQQINESLKNQVRQQADDLRAAQSAIIVALAKLAESRDNETGLHLERMSRYCDTLLQTMRGRTQFEESITDSFISDVCEASALHDIGKVGIRDAILQKPGRLSPEEFEEMKRHTTIGASTLREVQKRYDTQYVRIGIEIALSHHEHWDGKGYPQGLSGLEIPLSARVVALADVYNALISKRVYKEAFSHEVSLAIIQAERGKHFDPDVVDCFLDVEDQFHDISATFLEEDSL